MKLKNILKICIVLLVATLVSLFIFNKTKTVETNADAPTITVTGNKEENGYFMPDTAGLIHITITLSAVTNKDVIIEFYGRDATAISESGDYYYCGGASDSDTNEVKAKGTHELSKVTISSGSTSVSLNYKTYQTYLATSINNTTYRRYFYFEISQVDNATISKKEYKCGLEVQNALPTKSMNGGYTFSCYNTQHGFDTCTGWHTKGKTYTKTLLSSDVSSWAIPTLVNNDYAAVYCHVYYDVDACWPSTGSYDIEVYYGNSTSSSHMIAKGRTGGMGWDDDATCYAVNGTDSFNNSEWYKLPKSAGTSITLDIWNEAITDRRGNITTQSKLIDKWKFTLKKAYIDSSSIKRDGKVYISLRFSEPVQVIGDTSKISIIAKAGSNTVKFAYVEGNYTDTLVFETNINTASDLKDIKITTLTLDSLDNCNMIYDFGCGTDGKQNHYSSNKSGEILTDESGKKTVSCNIDLRIPMLSTSTVRPSEIRQTREVKVTVSRYASGRLYYSWSTDASKEFTGYEDYDSFIDIEKNESDSHELTVYGMDMTGEYYLYLYVISDFGKVTTVKLGITTKDDKGKDVVVGGYLFDNKKPTINKGDLVIDTLTNKTFLVTADDGLNNYDSKVVALYANIGTKKDLTDSQKFCIWSSDLSTNKVGITTSGYELTASAKRVYLTSNNEVVRENYNNTSELAVFSSKSAAIEYLEMIEYTDFRIVTLSQSKVQELKLGEGLADGEDKDKIVYLSTWIVYKKSTWDIKDLKGNNAQDQNMWVYYYYGGSIDELDPALISDNLKNAAHSVATTMANYGMNINFIEKGYVKDGVPYLSGAQAHAHDEITKTALAVEDNIKGGLVFEDTRLTMSATGGSCTVSLDVTNELIYVPENEFATFYIYFTAMDGAGNITDLPGYHACKYDRRTLFDSECTVIQNDESAENVDKHIETYDLDNGQLIFTFKSVLKESEAGTIGIRRIRFRGQLIDPADYSTYFVISEPSKVGERDSKFELEVKFPGYLEIELNLFDNNTEKVSNPYCFYITKGMKEETLNYTSSSGNNIYNNQVFQLGSEFTYMDDSYTIKKESYGSYYLTIDPTATISQNPATFSDKYVATDYVRYKEYQDFYVVILSDKIADYLNNGSTNKDFVKADGEDNNFAKQGQTWIRYKRKNWTTNSTQYDWVYYFYSDLAQTEISLSKISTNLNQAVNDVTTYIVSKGSEVKLVGADYTDKYGAPYIHYTQGHANPEATSKTKTGGKFNPGVSYNGDKNLFKNTVVDQSDGSLQEIPLVSNIELHTENNNLVYYAYYSGLVPINELNFKELVFVDGTTYRNAIEGATGTYVIREFGNEGVNQFKIYIDNMAPVLNASYVKAIADKGKEDQVIPMVLDSTVNGSTYSAKSFILGDLDGTKEQDQLCYVAIYNKNTMKLKTAYFYDFLLENSVTLENGEYYLIVSDRSGNQFNFTVLVNDQELNVNVRIIDQNCVAVDINRTAEQIYRYEVYLNNGQNKINEAWNGKTQRFYQSGYYNILVEDIYGFKVEIGGESGYSFERELPKLIWSYDYDGKETFKRYEEGVTKEMKITASLGSTFYINTSRNLRFTMDGEYEYSFTGIDKSCITPGYNGKNVTIKSTENWEMEIWYKQYPDIKSKYVCIVDMTPPEILVTYTKTTFQLDEQDALYTQAETAKLGSIYIPNTINYKDNIKTTELVTEGDIINSNLFKVDATDVSGIQTVEVYLENELLFGYDAADGPIPTISLSRYGTYKVIATDIFGNMSILNFQNALSEQASFELDSNEIITRDKKPLYGNTSAIMEFYINGVYSVKVTREDGSTYLYLFNVTDGIVYEAVYVCKIPVQYDSDGEEIEISEEEKRKEFVLTNLTERTFNQLGQEVIVDRITFSSTDQGNKVNRWYQIKTEMNDVGEIIDGFNLFVKFDKDQHIYFMVEALTTRIKVEMRASFGFFYEPYYYETYLSHEKTDVNLISNDETEIIIDHEGITYTNKPFSISEELDELITMIEVAYSDRRDFKDYTIIYPITEVINELEIVKMDYFNTDNNGFYSIRIYNKFGNVNEITLNKSDIFTVLTIAKYDDDTESRFNAEYEDITKANKQVIIEAYAYYATFEIIKDNENYDASIINDNSCYNITLNKEGVYKVKCKDNYGNEVVKEVIIKHSKLSYDERLITGYNEKALRKNEGYTNKKLTINKNKLDEMNIQYVSIKFDDNEEVIFNYLTQEKVELDTSKLVEAIGNSGNGDYTVIFRDEFGSIAKKVIHYRSDTTIDLSRKIRISSVYEYISLEKALSQGVWSNNIIRIDTIAEEYEAIVTEVITNNSYEIQCPKELSFSFQGSTTTLAYEIYYIDEYGFEYTFNATLFRKEIDIYTVDLEKKVINDIDTTRDYVKVAFSSGECTYSLDGKEMGAYLNSQILYKDGTYRFTVMDIAGNTSSLQIRKDTFVDFSIYDKEQNRNLINGEVVNKGTLTFKSNNNDKVEMKSFYLDGVKQSDLTQTNFTKHGHYVMIFEDQIGNTQIFEFYIITHEMSSFEYETPNGYFISNVTYSDSPGNYVSYMESGRVIQTLEGGSTFDIFENGEYEVVVTSNIYADGFVFVFEIDNTPPEPFLVGCKENEKTVEEVTIKGLEAGDTVYLYKDGELISTTDIITDRTDAPVITEGGKYKVVVKNKAGVTTTLSFQKTKIANTPGSVLIMIICFAIVGGIVGGVVMRNKQKFDE